MNSCSAVRGRALRYVPIDAALAVRTFYPNLLAAIDQFRQPGEIDFHLPRLVHREDAGVSCGIWIGSTAEHAELLPGRVLDGESARNLDDTPGRRNGWS